jgi:undecaprenyl-diphosphatase
MEQVLEFLDHIDKELLLFLHKQSTPFLDVAMVAVTEKYTWILLYLILILALIRQFGWQSVYSIVAVILLVIISDQLTSGLMKPFFGRLRPCHDPEIGHLIRIIRRCGGEFGFVSSHAANSVSVSTFFILLFRKSHRYVWWILIWPLLFSYSRIYMGVHYPLDVLCGAVVGIALGWLVYWGTEKLSEKVPFEFTPYRRQA